MVLREDRLSFHADNFVVDDWVPLDPTVGACCFVGVRFGCILRQERAIRMGLRMELGRRAAKGSRSTSGSSRGLAKSA